MVVCLYLRLQTTPPLKGKMAYSDKFRGFLGDFFIFGLTILVCLLQSLNAVEKIPLNVFFSLV